MPADWDARPHLALFDTGLVNGVPGGGTRRSRATFSSSPATRTHSLIVHRAAARNGYTRMPPLASIEIDEAGIQLLDRLDRKRTPDRQNYDDWRSFPLRQLPRRRPRPPTPTATAATTIANSSNSPIRCPRIRPLRSPFPPLPPPRTVPARPARPRPVHRVLDRPDPLVPWPDAGNDGLHPARPAAPGVDIPVTDPLRFFRTRIEER